MLPSLVMTTYFGLWKVETSLAPQDPKMAIQLYQAFGTQIKRDFESGVLKVNESFLEGNAGYFITGDITEETLHHTLLRFAPYVQFEIHRTIPALKTVEHLVAIAKERAAAMTVPA